MRTPHDMHGAPEEPVSDEAPVEQDELFIGELTAALAADARTAEDALPPAIAMLATQAGELFVREQRRNGPGVVPVLSAPAVSRASTSGSGRATAMAGRPSAARTFAVWGGWLAAAAVLALWTLDNRGAASDGRQTVAETRVVTPVVPSPGEVLRDSLLAADPALTRVAFTGTDDASSIGAGGEVLWSGAAQRGVMRIVGLQPNDKALLQYQLWIFDKLRDERYPVDGGVFDIPAGATEVFIPVSARVPVHEASLFAVTVEPAGGVVVSTRERVALLAEL